MNEGVVCGDDLEKARTLIRSLFGANIVGVKRLGGMTNRSYKTDLSDGRSLVVRFPGEGTDAIINRSDECLSTILGSACGVDTTLLYFGNDGVKIMEYIPGAETMTASRLREPQMIKAVAAIFRKLHSIGVDTKVKFDVFAMAEKYLSFIREKAVALFDDFDIVTGEVSRIKGIVDSECDIRIVPCHCDSLCENWVLDSAGRLYLIDWEYAGMNDAMWDLADISIEAAYDKDDDILLLDEYFCRHYTQQEYKNFTANKIYLDYLWTLWGKTRVPYEGKFMEQYALDRFLRLKESIRTFNGIH